jgi:predicted DNA-binding protein with PD1-like motif
MEYETGQTGRVLVLRLTDGDPVNKSIEDVARNEGISAATV